MTDQERVIALLRAHGDPTEVAALLGTDVDTIHAVMRGDGGASLPATGGGGGEVHNIFYEVFLGFDRTQPDQFSGAPGEALWSRQLGIPFDYNDPAPLSAVLNIPQAALDEDLGYGLEVFLGGGDIPVTVGQQAPLSVAHVATGGGGRFNVGDGTPVPGAMPVAQQLAMTEAIGSGWPGGAPANSTYLELPLAGLWIVTGVLLGSLSPA